MDFAAGGIATPGRLLDFLVFLGSLVLADAALMMQLGCDGGEF